jgi:hypothetical protein
LAILVKLGGQNQSKINQTSISEIKMGAQGDQAAPKTAKLKPNNAQSLPDIPRAQKYPKTTQKCDRKCPTTVKDRIKNTSRIGNDFGSDILIENFQFRTDCASPYFPKTSSKKAFLVATCVCQSQPVVFWDRLLGFAYSAFLFWGSQSKNAGAPQKPFGAFWSFLGDRFGHKKYETIMACASEAVSLSCKSIGF